MNTYPYILLFRYHQPDIADVRNWLSNFNWTHPDPNPNLAKFMRLRATFWNVIQKNEALKRSAHMFGLVPLPPVPVPVQYQSNLLFHLIFTTSEKSKVQVFGSKVPTTGKCHIQFS